MSVIHIPLITLIFEMNPEEFPKADKIISFLIIIFALISVIISIKNCEFGIDYLYQINSD